MVHAKIRLEIYRYILVCDGEIRHEELVRVDTSLHKYQSHLDKYRSCPNRTRRHLAQSQTLVDMHRRALDNCLRSIDIHPFILRACWLVFNGALPILYAKNWFDRSSTVEKLSHASLINPCQYRTYKHFDPFDAIDWMDDYPKIINDLAKRPKLSRVIIYVAGLEASKESTWNLNELAEALIHTEVVGELIFRPDWSHSSEGRKYNEEEKLELRKVVDAVKAANRGEHVLTSTDI